MAELANYLKSDLILLAKECEVEILDTDGARSIIKKIEKSPDFDRGFALSQIKLLSEDRIEKERKQKELDEKQKESDERERERQFELNKLKLQQQSETVSLNSSGRERKITPSLKNMMHKFDMETSDISLYLNLFERQAKMADIEESEWVNHLLALLPVKLAEQIIKLPEDNLADFEFVKAKLLERFKLNAEAFRSKFINFQRPQGTLWKDVIFDLRTYLDGWLECLEVKDFKGLKDLMVADQLKKRASPEMKDKFLDSWSKFCDPEALAEKFDDYESVRRINKKPWTVKNTEEKKGEKPKAFEKYRERKNSGEKTFNWRDQNSREQREKEKVFEKPRVLRCFECNSTEHLRPSCPKLKKKFDARISHVVSRGDLESSFDPYIIKGLVNEKETPILRDTGASIDLAPGRLVNPQKFTGESVWVKSPLSNELACLPIARIKLELPEIGVIDTKAAVLEKSIIMEHYLMGNQTQLIVDQKEAEPEKINAVVTRSQEAKLKSEPKNVEKEGNSETIRAEVETIDECQLPPSDDRSPVSLLRVNREEFKAAQASDKSLLGCWEKGRKSNNVEFEIENEILFRKVKDHRGEIRKQVVVPSKLRVEILKLCHEGVASHLGTTKTKDKLLRYYFWPNVIKDTEEFVRTCHPCQKVGKPGETKKAPLKLVPIISEVFAKLNVDLVGPLPESENKNKYLLTAMCLSSKYPDAIPLADVKSTSVIDALLQVFSRLGFPKQLQMDLGRSFISELTETFLDKFGIKVIHSSVHRPQSNAVERFHRTIKRLLKVLCLESGESWERTLPFALLTLRTVTHESTGFSPAELVHGKNLRTPETLLFEKWTEKGEEENPVTKYVFTLINRLKRCQDIAVENMERARDKRKQWYDRDTIERKFKPGDKVLVMATVKPNKLAVSWMGPGTVVSQISETNYIVSLPNRREKSQIFHINLLKPYHKRAETVNVLLSEQVSSEINEADLEIVYPNANPDIYDFEEIIREGNLKEKCSPEQLAQLEQVLNRHRKLFSNDSGRTDLIEHNIELISDQPIRIRPYRTSPRQTEILKQEIKRMLDLGVIEVGESDFSSPLILVEAPGRDPRPCVDYRKLNSVTRAEYFPLPNIEERIELVAGARYITVIDLTKGYWQIPLTPQAQRYAAFSTAFGSYRPLTMPFGLLNAPFCFSKFMATLLQGCEKYCVPYLDDVAIFSDTWETHMEHLDKKF
ncbi:Retrovirus-related Pol polyprotein from transposon 412 [Araneus ventricosus]|uniref:RNA-directed DNA polymerase n=1 Tax=Araneus ventricosus TaxID=182803 RepID=A0A4Y2BQ15_ARAVE|nr:Retrovirus-related Pol polyprotein from transposon 412 [Araneus ventricosus]GBL94074.1 Retrovirus-related Pol polyprotein from transposon 412 [Araneus ventricosus]